MIEHQVIYRSANGIWVKHNGTTHDPRLAMMWLQQCAREHPGCRVGVVKGSWMEVDEAIDKLNRGVSIGVGFEGLPIGKETTQGESVIDVVRRKMEEGAGGDHDAPYSGPALDGLPAFVLAKWVTLQARVTRGELVP